MFGSSLTICFYVLCISVTHYVQSQTAQLQFQPIYKQDEHIRNDRSKEMLKYLNSSADPCEDFYAYACGNWQNYQTSLKKIVKTIQQHLEEKVDRDLQFLLKEDVTINDGFNGRKVKDFYKSCKNALANGQQQQEFFSEFIKLNGGFPAVPGSNWEEHHPNYEWETVVAKLRYHYHMDILMRISVEPNPLNLFEYTIFLTEPSSTILPSDLCNAEIDQTIISRRSEYEKIEKNVANNLRSWLSIESGDAEKVANSILVFELELCRAMTIATTEQNNNVNTSNMNYTRGTLHEFTNHFNHSINFHKFVDTSYAMPFPKPVFLRSERYYENLFKTIAIRDKATIANYIMYRALSLLSFPLNDDNKDTRLRFCTEIIKRYFPKVLGSIYYHRFASMSVKNNLEGIFEKLKIAFENSLRSPWIQEDTSRIGIHKLHDISLYLPNYEEKLNLNHLNISTTNYWLNLAQVMHQPRNEEFELLFANNRVPQPNAEVEAYDVQIKYRSQYKRIDIGWALLQAPYYQSAYPHSMLFATIGQQIARELAYAFNDIGWTSDILNLENWDHMTALVYGNHTECFREQISYYLNQNADAFQNKTQLRELIAMSAGVNVAFAAYLDWLDFLNPINDFAILRKETLAGLNFTNTQLFFIAYAQMHCHFENMNNTFADTWPSFKHSLERYKVNGPLWNSYEFGKEFGCLLGSEMNQADKCFIY